MVQLFMKEESYEKRISEKEWRILL